MKNQNKVHFIFIITLISFALMFITIGCEREQIESSDLTESFEQTQLVTADTENEELEVIIERNVPVPMRDGTILRADVHRPDRGGPYPVIVQRTRYGKDGNYGY